MGANGFGNMVFTQAGLNLLAKAQTGTPIQFTRIAVGDGYLNGQDPTKFTNLIEQIMSLNITSCVVSGLTAATISAVLSNSTLLAGFYWREIGIFALDPQLGEILYGYDNSTGHEIYVPPIATSSFTIVLNIAVYISNSANVTVIIDPNLVYAKSSDLALTNGVVATKAPLASPIFTGVVNLPSNSVSDSLLISLNAAITATGTTQTNATVLTKDMNVITLGAGGVVVQGATTGKIVVIINKTANPINIYPAVGHYFDGLAVNIPISLPPMGFIELYGFSNTQWNSTVNAITNASNTLIADIGNIIIATTMEGALQEVVTNLNSHLTDNLLRLDIKGSIQVSTVVSNQFTQILHQVSGVTVRTDIFTYTPTLITEVRTLAAGGTVTFKYHLDTLQTEVI